MAESVNMEARDWNGKFVAVVCKQIHAPLGPLEVESKAVEVGLLFAKQLGVFDFIIEGDSLIVSRALSQSSSVPASIDAVIMGIRSAALEYCYNVYFSHVKRNANTPTHLLAKYAKGIVHHGELS
uniref:RNase H type-1 domain-containing protein n=1 Tax=Quercus lobata TaxID=97700 RepID=A0A7N2M8M5_QUELO